ncbi:hypothetical protein RP20_CCG013335 [Aedes albopictus]|nr:hypothetical protein RP20_CCG013335 [Aedes albopictus]
MPWYAPWSNVIKKKVCRFLLQRYLGQFIEEKLSLDQLNVDFYNGTGTVYDVTLYSQEESPKDFQEESLKDFHEESLTDLQEKSLKDFQ